MKYEWKVEPFSDGGKRLGKKALSQKLTSGGVPGNKSQSDSLVISAVLPVIFLFYFFVYPTFIIHIFLHSHLIPFLAFITISL